MSYRFNTSRINYEWISEFKDFHFNELYQHSLKQIDLKIRFQNLFKRVKEAFTFGSELYSTISKDGTDLYEEVNIKLLNCSIYMEQKFDEKAQELLSGLLFSEQNYERYLEILNSYTEVITRSYQETMDDKLNQVGRIATGIYGLIDDLQFTLELNGLLNHYSIKNVLPELLNANYLTDDTIRKEANELPFIDKDLKELICA